MDLEQLLEQHVQLFSQQQQQQAQQQIRQQEPVLEVQQQPADTQWQDPATAVKAAQAALLQAKQLAAVATSSAEDKKKAMAVVKQAEVHLQMMCIWDLCVDDSSQLQGVFKLKAAVIEKLWLFSMQQ
jgi:thiamine biosynthesis lipoprotein ApbE